MNITRELFDELQKSWLAVFEYRLFCTSTNVALDTYFYTLLNELALPQELDAQAQIQWLKTNPPNWITKYIPDWEMLLAQLESVDAVNRATLEAAQEFTDPQIISLDPDRLRYDEVDTATQLPKELWGGWDLYGGWRQNPPKESNDE